MATEDQIKMLEVLREQGLITDDQQKIIEVLSESGELDKNLPRIIRGIAKRAKQQEQEPEPEPRQPETTGERFKRTLGIGARDIAQGAASTVGIFSDPIALALNQLTPENYKFPSAREAVKNMLDRLGVPTPELEIEKRISTINEMMAGGLAGVGVGKTIAKATGGLPKQFGTFLAEQPERQAKGLIGASGGVVAAQEAGLGPRGELLASMVGGSMATRPKRTTPLKLDPLRVLPGEAEAKQHKIDVLTSDVYRPKQFASKWLQATSEKIPFGTGARRKEQYKQRQEATRTVVKKYGSDIAPEIDVIDPISKDFFKKYNRRLSNYVDIKKGIFKDLEKSGTVEVKNTIKAIDKEIEKLKSINPRLLKPGIDELESLKGDISGKSISILDENRKLFGEKLAKDDSLATIKGNLEKSASKIYSALNKDIGSFIKSHKGDKGFNRWKVSNERIKGLIDQKNRGKLKSLIRLGENEPERIKPLILSKNYSDLKTIYQKLSPTGKANVRTLLIKNSLEKAGGIDNISPEKFINHIKKMPFQKSVFFKGGHADYLKGFQRALEITRRSADAAVMPPTGVQNVGVGIGSFLMESIKQTIGAIGVGLTSQVFESEPVKKALKQLGRTKPYTQKELFYSKRAVAAINAVMKKHEADEKKRKGER